MLRRDQLTVGLRVRRYEPLLDKSTADGSVYAVKKHAFYIKWDDGSSTSVPLSFFNLQSYESLDPLDQLIQSVSPHD